MEENRANFSLSPAELQPKSIRTPKMKIFLRCFFVWAILFLITDTASGRSTGCESVLNVISSFPDTLLTESSRDTTRAESSDSLFSKNEWRAGDEKSNYQIGQDVLQLVESTLPVLPVHSGDFGLPTFLGAGGLPPRLVDIHVYGIRWLPGVHGLVDATGVPEILAEEISLQNLRSDFKNSIPQKALAFSFTPKPTNFRTPVSSLSFVRGPFGGDAIRAAISRRLSSKVRIRFSLDEANSNGQFSDLPYDGQKLHTELNYSLSKNAALRYNYFDSRNESGVMLPVYPVWTKDDSIGFGKEQRIYHGIEFSLPAAFVRAFYWNLRNEWRGDATRFSHRTKQAGIEAGWQKRWQRLRTRFFAEIVDNRFTSTSVLTQRSQSYQTRGEMDWVSRSNLQAGAAMSLHKDSEWPAALDLDFDFGLGLGKNLRAQALLNRRVINPAPGEYADTLGIININNGLQPAELRRGAIMLSWQLATRRVLQIQFALNHLKEPFVLESSQSGDKAILINGGNKDVPSLDFLTDWQLNRKINFSAHGSLMLDEAPSLYWYENVRRSFARAYIEFRHDFFAGDLATRLRVAMRHYGKSFASINSTTTTLLADVEVPGAQLFDIQLFLRHRNLSFYFSFENILNKDFDWRPGIAAPGYFLKWGARVDLKN